MLCPVLRDLTTYFSLLAVHPVVSLFHFYFFLMSQFNNVRKLFYLCYFILLLFFLQSPLFCGFLKRLHCPFITLSFLRTPVVEVRFLQVSFSSVCATSYGLPSEFRRIRFSIFFLDVHISSLPDGSVIFFFKLHPIPLMIYFSSSVCTIYKGQGGSVVTGWQLWESPWPWQRMLVVLSLPFAQALLGIQLILPPCHSSPKPHRWSLTWMYASHMPCHGWSFWNTALFAYSLRPSLSHHCDIRQQSSNDHHHKHSQYSLSNYCATDTLLLACHQLSNDISRKVFLFYRWGNWRAREIN